MKAYSILILSALSLMLNSFASDLPSPAKQLQDAYRRVIDTALIPAQERYISDLNKSYDRLLRDGNVEGAKAVKIEVNGVPIQYVAGQWKYIDATSNKWQSFSIHWDGRATHSNGAKGEWKTKGRDILIEWENGYSYSMPLVPAAIAFEGRMISPEKKVSRFLLSRSELSTEQLTQQDAAANP